MLCVDLSRINTCFLYIIDNIYFRQPGWVFYQQVIEFPRAVFQDCGLIYSMFRLVEVSAWYLFVLTS